MERNALIAVSISIAILLLYYEVLLPRLYPPPPKGAAQEVAKNVNPDSLSHEAMAAELTNHLVDGVVLTPGIVATLLELQRAGFHYIG